MRLLLGAMLTLAAGCDSIGGPFSHACTLIGCANGTIVYLNGSLPANGKVEIFLSTDLTTPVQTYTCGPGSCASQIQFMDFMPGGQVRVRVTTANGVTLTAPTAVQYSEWRPNGPDCEPTCIRGRLDAQLPA